VDTVVVTGGAGFIGSHLVELLVNRGYRVLILDDLSTGKMINIEPLLKNKDVEFIKGSITDISLLQRTFKQATYIFHLAAVSSVPGSIADPVPTNNTNINGTLNVLLTARDNRVKKVIYASSAAVYGETPKLPQTEDMVPQPLSPYAVSKLTAEYYCRVFNHVYKLPVISLRYFNVYGPRQDPESQYAAVIPRFITTVIDKRSPIVFGDGKQVRDFVFVRDVAKANIIAAESDAVGVYNIARGERVSVNRLAQLIIKLTGNNDIKPVFTDPRPGDIRDSVAGISRAKGFGYNPEYSLEQGLKDTIKYFQTSG
jgi:UDP-glucose 4-epimerase